MRVVPKFSLIATVLVLAAGCSVKPLARGFACEADGGCASDYSCDTATNTCITVGDGCGTDGATSPCVFGETTCARGCRTCTGGAWTDCGSAGDECADADGDGLGDGTGGNVNCVDTTTDSDDTDATVCADTDNDGCDDCSVTSTWTPNDDGTDTDGDGLCYVGDPCTDVDGDGVGNGANGNSGCIVTDIDSNDADANVCADTDGDTCDDCSSGSFDLATDGPDADGDTICDAGDWCATYDDTLCGTTPVCDALVKLILTCTGPGNCSQTVIANCDDGDPCTADTCDAAAATACTNTAIPAGGDCGICGVCDAGGACIDDLTQDGDCPLCQECSAVGTCTDQADGDDINNDCPVDACNLGTCNGSGGCNATAAGIDCGTCAACDGTGFCTDDLTQDADCALCEECAAGGTCAQQANGSDAKDDCGDGTFCNGDEACDGTGACGGPPGNPCAVPASCDEAAGTCGCTVDSNCPACQTCDTGMALCVDAGAGTDIKNDCDAANPCLTGDCDGSGACAPTPVGTDCDICGACDGAGQCVDDNSQDVDCGFCQECAARASCTNQSAGTDVKADCDDSLFCTGVESCDGSGGCTPGAGNPCGGAAAVCDEANSACVACLADTDCPPCQQCNGTTFICENQLASSDTKNDCSDTNACLTGNCDGGGACGLVNAGVDCDVCGACDGSGSCVYDGTQDIDCATNPCQECSAMGACADQQAGFDVNNDCDNVANPCLTGVCDAAGACALAAPGFDCDVCGTCDSAGVCAFDPTQDVDCSLCDECSALATCAPQAPGVDVKSDCTNGVFCDGLETCDGASACAASPGDPCTAPAVCDEANKGCTGCLVDTDCGPCQRCQIGTPNLCVPQAPGTDTKNDCDGAANPCITGSCDGSGGCEPASSTKDCGVCAKCDGGGVCAYDPLQDQDCATICEECVNIFSCGPQALGQDVKTECPNANYCDGVETCNGASACGAPPGSPCSGLTPVCDEVNDVCVQCLLDTDCGLCEKCRSNTCVAQLASEDLKNECDGIANVCLTGTCDGGGACGLAAATKDCGICSTCDGSGNCTTYDASQNIDCPICERCAGLGTCAPQAAGSDLNGDCAAADACNTGCNGSGACGFAGAGSPCGVRCATCDGSGTCGQYDPSADIDCPLCEECSGVGTCAPQTAGNDVKTECDNGTFCDGLETCDGFSACIPPPGDPCVSQPLTPVCDEAGTGCVECLADGDCPVCEKCVANACVFQTNAEDLKSNCSNTDPCLTGFCNGAGGCDVQAAGTDCGICSTCDVAGACNVYDATQDVDCNLCMECSALGVCANQPNTTDVKNDCDDGLFCTGDELCDGAGACDPVSPGDPCAPQPCNEAAGTCGCTVDTECGFCLKCDNPGTMQCIFQTTAEDTKAECDNAANPCLTGFCDNAGACDNQPNTWDCDVCGLCDGAGTCAYDATQNVDCNAIICQQCTGLGACGNATAGTDPNGDCSAADPCLTTGNCSALGACEAELAGVVCDICGRCDGATAGCKPDLTKNADCTTTCQECAAMGSCQNQNGSDWNNDCPDPANDCTAALCDAGGGACDIVPDATPCTTCVGGAPCGGCLGGVCQPLAAGCGPTDDFNISLTAADCAPGTTDVVVMDLTVLSACDNTLNSISFARHANSNTLDADLVNIRLYQETDLTPGFAAGDTLLAGPVAMVGGAILFPTVNLVVTAAVSEQLYLVADAGATPSYFAAQITSTVSFGLADTGGTKSLGATPLVGGAHSMAGRVCDGTDPTYPQAVDPGVGSQKMASANGYKANANPYAGWSDDKDSNSLMQETSTDLTGAATSDCDFDTGVQKIKDKGTNKSEFVRFDTGVPLGLPIDPAVCTMDLRLFGSDYKNLNNTGAGCNASDLLAQHANAWIYSYTDSDAVADIQTNCAVGNNLCRIYSLTATPATTPAPPPPAVWCPTDYVTIDVVGMYDAATNNIPTTAPTLELRFIAEADNNPDGNGGTRIQTIPEIYIRLY